MSNNDDANVYRVYCEDCELNEIYDPESPPDHLISYWGSVAKAKEKWSAKSAAKGKRDNHRASEFRDYGEGIRHRARLEQVPRKDVE